MTSFAGSWGQSEKPRTRYTRSITPGQTGGMNAQGDVSKPRPVASSTSQSPSSQINYGGFPKIEPVKAPSYADARWQRNVGDLQAGIEQNRAQTLRDLDIARQREESGREDLLRQRGMSHDQLSSQMGSQNATRSGARYGAHGMVQKDYQKNLDELLRQFGPDQQQLLRDLYQIASKQHKVQLASEASLAAGREKQYQQAGQTPPKFDPSIPPMYLQPETSTTTPKKKKEKKK